MQTIFCQKPRLIWSISWNNHLNSHYYIHVFVRQIRHMRIVIFPIFLQVSRWVTFSDPLSVAKETCGFETDNYYTCVYNILKAHGCIYQSYKNTTYSGKQTID